MIKAFITSKMTKKSGTIIIFECQKALYDHFFTEILLKKKQSDVVLLSKNRSKYQVLKNQLLNITIYYDKKPDE